MNDILNEDFISELRKRLWIKYDNGLGVELLNCAICWSDGTIQGLICKLESLKRPEGGTWLVATSDIINGMSTIFLKWTTLWNS